MSDAANLRRMVADIRSGGKQASFVQVGNRSIHQYWTQLAPYFRNSFLVPQRRPDGSGVSWNWREPADGKAPTATELAELRRRLTAANKTLAHALADGDVADGEGNPNAPLLKGFGEMVAKLVGKNDAGLGAYACRTESGIMVHSWGATAPAVPYQADARDYEVSGKLFVGEGESAADLAVVIENRQGAVLARTQTDPAGEFRFKEIASGSYRVRVTDKVDFPPGGQLVTVEGNSIAGLEFRRGSLATAGEAESRRESPTHSRTDDDVQAAKVPGKKSRQRLAWIIIGVLLAAGGGWLIFRPSADKESAAARATSASARDRLAIASTTASASRGDSQRQAATSASENALAPNAATPTASPGGSTGSAGSRNGAAGSSNRGSNSNTASSAQAARAERPEQSQAESAVVEHTASQSTAEQASRSDVAKDAQDSAESPSDSPESTDTVQRDPAESDPGANSEISGDGADAEASNPGSRKPTPQAKRASSVAKTAAIGASSAPGAAAENDLKNSGATQVGAKSPSAKIAAKTPPKSGTATAKKNAPKASRLAASDSEEAAAEAAETADEVADALAEETDQQPAKNRTLKKPRPMKRKAAQASSTETSQPVGLDTDPDAGLADDPAPVVEEDLAETPAPPVPIGAKAKKKPQDVAAAANIDDKDEANSDDESAPEQVSDVAVENLPKPKIKHAPVIAKAALPNEAPAPASSSPPTEEPPSSALLGIFHAAVAQGDDSGLTLSFVSSPWKLRMVQDTILPTLPVLETNTGSVDALRQKLRAEQVARIPPALKSARMLTGFSFALRDSTGGAAISSRWETIGGDTLTKISVRGGRAEVSWIASRPPSQSSFVLRAIDGRELARVSIDGEGVPTVKAGAGARTSVWFALERMHARNPGTSMPPFVWRLPPGAAPTSSPAQSDLDETRSDLRIDLALDSTATAHYALALVDPQTGWALKSDLKIR